MNFLDLCYSQHDYFTKIPYLTGKFLNETSCNSEHKNKFNKLINSLPEYKLLSSYRGSDKYVTIKHLICGTIWKVTPHSFGYLGTRCPTCAHKGVSKLERTVQRKLQKMNIPYLREYRFPECRDKYPLPFDFVLLDKEGNIFMALEVDGKQHHEPVSIFGGEKAFKTVQKHDQIKEQFCKEKGIQFKRITRKDLQIL